jgi:hypothetical protein
MNEHEGYLQVVRNDVFRKDLYSTFSLVSLCVVIVMCFAVDANLSSSNVAPEGSRYSVPLARLGVRGTAGSEGETTLWC